MTQLRTVLLAGLLSWILAGVLVLLTGAPASAHASLLRTDPAQGAVLQKAPDQVVLTFNEPVRLDTHFVRGFTADGSDWDVAAVAEDNRVVVTPNEDPGTGTVVITWKVVSADGHIVGGSLDFSVGTPTKNLAAPGAIESAPPTSTLVARALAALLAIGGLASAVAIMVLGRPARWSDLAWSAGFAGVVVLAPLQQLAHDGRSPAGLTDWVAWLDGVARWPILLLVLAYLVVALARGRGRPTVVAAGVPAAVLLVLAGLTWPSLPAPPAEASDASAQPGTSSADLGTSGTVELTVRPGDGRSVALVLRLLGPDGAPLTPYRKPAVEVRNDDLTLGDANVERTGAGSYRASITIPRGGAWTAQVSVRVDEFDNPVAVVPFTL